MVDFGDPFFNWWRASKDNPQDDDWFDTGLPTSDMGAGTSPPRLIPFLDHTPVSAGSDGYVSKHIEKAIKQVYFL
jgi:hypothetical protein